MPPAELLQWRHAQPFVPFRIYLVDGTMYEVWTARFLMVGRDSAIVGIPDRNVPELCAQTARIDLRHVVRVERIQPVAQEGNGRTVGEGAMPPDEIRNYLRAQPFVPFRIRLTDGRSFDVRYRELAMLGPRIVVIGIPVPEAEEPLPLIQSSTTVSLLHVISVEPIQPAAPPGNGQAAS